MKRQDMKSKEQHKLAAKLIADGKPVSEALLAAGWSEKQARKGKAALSKPVRIELAKIVGKDFGELVEIGRSVEAEPDSLRQAVLGSVVKGIADRSDAGVQMTKLAGQWKGVNMWQPENQVGVIMINGGNVAAGPEILDVEVIEPKLLDE